MLVVGTPNEDPKGAVVKHFKSLASAHSRWILCSVLAKLNE